MGRARAPQVPAQHRPLPIAAHSGPIFHMVTTPWVAHSRRWRRSSYGRGRLSTGRRLLLGVMADRVGAKPVLVVRALVRAGGRHYLSSRSSASSCLGDRVHRPGGVMPLYAIRRASISACASWATFGHLVGGGQARWRRAHGRRLGPRHLRQLRLASTTARSRRSGGRGGGAHLQAGAGGGQAQDGGVTTATHFDTMWSSP